MKANGKYTALDILTEAGVKDPEEILGHFFVSIGGVVVNSPENTLIITPGTESLEIIIGNEKQELAIDGEHEENVLSDHAQEVVAKEGEIERAKSEELEAPVADEAPKE